MYVLPSIDSHCPTWLTQHREFLIAFRHIPMSIHLALLPPLCISVDMFSPPVSACQPPALSPNTARCPLYHSPMANGRTKQIARACRASAQCQRLAAQNRKCYCVYDPSGVPQALFAFVVVQPWAILHSQRIETVRPPAVC